MSVTHLLADAAARCRAPRPGAPAPRGARGRSGLPAPLSAGAHVPGWNLALRASCHWGSPGSWSQPPTPVRSAAYCLPFSARWRNRPGGSAVVAEGGLVQRHQAGLRYHSRCPGEGLPGAPGPGQAASRVPRGQRADWRAFAQGLGGATIPVNVWVDQRNLVRRVQISLHRPAAPGFRTVRNARARLSRAAIPGGLPGRRPGHRRTARRQLAAALPWRLLRRLPRP